MAAVKAQELRVAGSRCQEADPMSRQNAAQWMLDRCDFRFRPQESVAAPACVFDETIASSHGRDAVTENSAQVSNLLVEHRGVGIRIAVGGKQQGMSALNADVLVMIVPIDKVLIRVMSEKTGQRVTDVRQGTVRSKIRGPTPAGPAGRIRVCKEGVIVDVVAPQRATYSLCATEDGSCSRHGDLLYEAGIPPRIAHPAKGDYTYADVERTEGSSAPRLLQTAWKIRLFEPALQG
jgi:hypothetical protein